MPVPRVDVKPCREGLHVSLVEAGVVDPDVGPERRAEDLAKAHPAEHHDRDGLRLTERSGGKGRGNEGGIGENMHAACMRWSRGEGGGGAVRVGT